MDNLFEEAHSVSWSPGTRMAFRFGFCYFLIFALCCGNATLWQVLPVLGIYVEGWLHWPFVHAGLWLGQHLFRLTGVGATLHGGGSGDRAVDWISLGTMLIVAVVATLVWNTVDRQPEDDAKLFRWFRFVIRLALGGAMVGYGMAKLFPLQMAPPSLAVLSEPVGNTSPMTLLWTLIGLNPGYEMVCGGAEVLAGLLILCRRTALLGALLTSFVTANIVLYNFFFDVPVKIYATNLFLMSVVLILPDVGSLSRYFWLHEPTAPTGPWAPLSERRWLRRTLVAAEVWILVTVGLGLPILDGISYAQMHEGLKHPSVLTGQWHLTSATKPYLTGDGQPMTDLFIEPIGLVMIRSSDNALWRGTMQMNDEKHTLQLSVTGHDGDLVYGVNQPDASILILTPTGKHAQQDGALKMTRVPLPSHYPLEDRGFHWINEWGLER